MGKVTLQDFIYLMDNPRVIVNEKNGLTPKQFFNGVSKNKCNYKVTKRVPALDYGVERIVIKKETFPTKEHIEMASKEYEDEHMYSFLVDIPPIGSCIKYFFGNKVEYDGGYTADGNILAHDYLFMLTLPVNLDEIPKSIVSRFTVAKMYTKNIFYNGTQYFYMQSNGKPMHFTKYDQMLLISNKKDSRRDDEAYEKLIKDIRFSKMVCKDHSCKLLVSREKNSNMESMKPYVGEVFKILSKIH
jgi:hypothetical protein